MEHPVLKKKVFPAQLSELSPVLEWVGQLINQTSLPSKGITHLQIAVEEALVNVIRYGYPGGAGVIELLYEYHPEWGVEVVIRDEGIPFNPTKAPHLVNKEASLEEREIGGLGIPLIRSLVDEIQYTRKQNTNYLTLRKRL